MLDPPAQALEPHAHVFTEGEMSFTFDRDGVVVIDPAEIGEPQMAGDGGGLGCHALHHVAITAEHISVVIEDRVARRVVSRGQPASRHRHPDGVAAALAERSGGGLDSGRHVLFGVACADAVKLAKLLDLFQ